MLKHLGPRMQSPLPTLDSVPFLSDGAPWSSLNGRWIWLGNDPLDGLVGCMEGAWQGDAWELLKQS